MPNWCHNTLTVTGEPNDVKSFITKVRGDDTRPLTFCAHVPEPNYDAEPADESSKFPDWYDWRWAHWGTKWDTSFDEELRRPSVDTTKPGVAVYKFSTAWSP